MSFAVLELFEDINKLKRWFADFAGLDKKYEAYKIWARWLITHMSLRKQPNVFLPSVGIDNDLQILLELTNKGCKRASIHYRSLVEQVNQIVSKYEHKLLIDSSGGYNVKINIKNMGDSVCLSPTTKKGLSMTIPKSLYSRLTDMYRFTGKGLSAYMNNSIWRMYALYHMLDGKSLQWAVPKAVFKQLTREFGCVTELFASPLNANYKKYYSLYDVDRKFGSKGSFFEAPATDFKNGCYQINPPFIDVVFTETSTRVLKYLEDADVAGRELTFIYIMPDWDDLSGYDMLYTSKYCVRVIRVNAGEHYYYQSTNDTYVRVYFTTNVLILSTNSEICPDYKARKIISGFKNPFRTYS